MHIIELLYVAFLIVVVGASPAWIAIGLLLGAAWYFDVGGDPVPLQSRHAPKKPPPKPKVVWVKGSSIIRPLGETDTRYMLPGPAAERPPLNMRVTVTDAEIAAAGSVAKARRRKLREYYKELDRENNYLFE